MSSLNGIVAASPFAFYLFFQKACFIIFRAIFRPFIYSLSCPALLKSFFMHQLPGL
ncbi:hypothetical membrane protein [Pelotomaculum thermopropionicum SI]|uniref:Hypothetical membrane protein n=1 Tax=Pelotomaculum thermopropionicum (strain DSM 13744 / JCM 10971 / SI) TaxID=370438 RepID=A5CYS7_PELTS|nr:hypothetical membrane protein [Pelotomaculum thermopropionicum SI]